MARKKLALTREVAPSIVDCELTFLGRAPIDFKKAQEQHAKYRAALALAGAEVIHLENPAGLPDAVFVEDPAIILDEIAVVTRPGAASRLREADDFAAILPRYRTVIGRLGEPATLDGGDVLTVGKTLFVGLSRRTNSEGVRQLQEHIRPLGYRVQTVDVPICLHLKTGCSFLGERTLLVNPIWVSPRTFQGPFQGFRVLETDPSEPFAANALLVGETILYPAGYPKTRGLLAEAGFRVTEVDISELQKAEAGLTCMSQIFAL